MVPDKFNFDRCLKIQSSKLHFQAYKHDLDIVTSRHMNFMYSCPGKIDTFPVPSKSRKCVNLSGEKIEP